MITRRDFLKLSAAAVGGLALNRYQPALALAEFPQALRLGRVCYGRWELKARPDYDSPTVDLVYDDQVLPWIREVVGRWPYRNNQRWVETPEGYVWGAYFQPVRNDLNEPLIKIPDSSGAAGMWVEVTVPYVDLVMVNPPPRHAYFRSRYDSGLPLRFYYSQILWVDQIRVESDGRVLYRVNEKYGNRGDLFWADGRAFRPITPDELAPIHPEAADKRIVVDISTQRQALSCFEGQQEVFYCRVSSGKKAGSTPLGTFRIFNKYFSLHMEGGTAVEGWDTGGVGWSSLFAQGGVAIHSTYWHHNYGEEESNGCINVAPQHAKWIFRWSSPVSADIQGNVTVTDFSGTPVSILMAA